MSDENKTKKFPPPKREWVLVIGDTHKCNRLVIEHIIRKGLEFGVGSIIHTGDIEKMHVDGELFGNLPVYCALVEDQASDPFFVDGTPPGWIYTRSGPTRIVTLKDLIVAYIGHQKPMEFLRQSEEELCKGLGDLKMLKDKLRYVFGGHLHLQVCFSAGLITLVNPGAAENSLGWGYEFAFVNTETGEIIYDRILHTKDSREPFSVAVISDSLDITSIDPGFWSRFADELRERDVKEVIHCGNLYLKDIGRPELADRIVHYSIRKDQLYEHGKMNDTGKIPPNWKVIPDSWLDNGAIVVIGGYHFYVEHDLGLVYTTLSGLGMDKKAMEIGRRFPETQFVLCGLTRTFFMLEGEQVTTINPGDLNNSHCYVVIHLPNRRITFKRVPYPELPPLPPLD